jgi:hypothetical protein
LRHLLPLEIKEREIVGGWAAFSSNAAASARSFAPPRPANRNIAIAKIAWRSPRSAASENHASAFFSSFGTPSPLAYISPISVMATGSPCSLARRDASLNASRK